MQRIWYSLLSIHDFLNNFFYLFNFVAMGLCYCTRALSNYSKWRLLSGCSAQSSHCSGFSCCRAPALGRMGSVVAAPRFQSTGSIVEPHRLTSSEAHGILPVKGSNPCRLHWQADSLLLSHQGSPPLMIFFKVSED